MRLPKHFLQGRKSRARKFTGSNTRTFCLFTAYVHAAAFVAYLIITIVQDYGVIAIPRLKTPVTRNTVIWTNASEQATINATAIGSLLDLTQCPLANAPSAKDSAFVVQQLILDANGYEIDTRVLIIVFHLLSAAFQFALGYSDNYNSQLDRGVANYSHFVEYSISASVLLLAMATQAMITDVFLLTSIAANCTGCMIMGLLAEILFEYEAVFSVDYRTSSDFSALEDKAPSTEPSEEPKHNDINSSLSIHAYWVAHLTGWLLISIAMISANSNLISMTVCAGDDAKRIPWFVQCLVSGEILCFMCFGLVQTSSFIRRNTAEGITDERARNKTKSDIVYTAEFLYILLSATAKLFLGFVVFIGNYTNK